MSELTPIDWAKRPLLKYAQFSGRAPRAEFWWYVLAVIIISIVARIIDNIVGLNVAGTYGMLSMILSLGLLVPNLAVAVRRLHDTNRTGWWILLPVVPYCLAFFFGGAAMMGGAASGSAMGMGAGLGIAMIFMLIGLVMGIMVLVFYCMQGTQGDNRFGPDPYGAAGSPTLAAE